MIKKITGSPAAVRAVAAFFIIGVSFGLSFCGGISSRRLQLDPESEKFYETAKLIMSREEEKIFSFLTDQAARKEFIQEFWDKRDPDPETPESEFKVEFESRVEYASKHFIEGGRGWNTDRGRIYIFMGPPDKFEEYFTHSDPSVRGSILYWIYYDYQLGIEFVDAKNDGQYKIRRYDGDFFGAMDALKLGRYAGPDDVFKKKFVKFELNYDQAAQKISIRIPARDLVFSEDAGGGFYVELDFRLYIYGRDGSKLATIEEQKKFATSVREIDELKEAVFEFAFALPEGRNYVDVLISGGGGKTGKVRRIFTVK